MPNRISHRMQTDLRTFERAVQDGSLAREGCRVDGHACEFQEAWRQRGAGARRPYHGERLAVGDAVERTWRCRKAGFAKRFDMENFTHREVIGKPDKRSMSVTDHLHWHNGQSRASRRYTGAGGDDGITLTLDPWTVNMRGVGGKLRWLRGQLERTMRGQFPKRVDQPLVGVIAGLGNAGLRCRWVPAPMDLVTLRD